MIPPISSLQSLLGNEFKVSGLGAGVPTAVGPQGLSGAAPSGSSGANFGDALSKAIGSLDNSQISASNASEQLATGKSTDPTTAITDVENASLTMNFASQIRNQLDSAASTIFQTQL